LAFSRNFKTSDRGGPAPVVIRDTVARGIELDERDPGCPAGSIANAPPIGSSAKVKHSRADLLKSTSIA
jgi:hypothetical protein